MIVARLASLRELEEWWSIDDLADANDALNAVAEAEREALNRHRPRGMGRT